MDRSRHSGMEIDSGDSRLNYDVLGFLLQQTIPSLVQETTTSATGFFLSHPDLSTSSIIVDDDANIICVIGWAFSCTVPSSTLSVSPVCLIQGTNIDFSCMSAFQEGLMEGIGADQYTVTIHGPTVEVFGYSPDQLIKTHYRTIISSQSFITP